MEAGVPARPTTDSTRTTVATATTTTVAPTGESTGVIADIVYDAPGNDVEYHDSEYVILRNDGSSTVDVGGWQLVDAKDHSITIPSGYNIPAVGTLRIYTDLVTRRR